MDLLNDGDRMDSYEKEECDVNAQNEMGGSWAGVNSRMGIVCRRGSRSWSGIFRMKNHCGQLSCEKA